jgi:hypothetical protein
MHDDHLAVDENDMANEPNPSFCINATSDISVSLK